LKNHHRSSDVCSLIEQEPLEGLDKSQVDQLKNRKSMFRAGSEEEKWKIIYLIIFPDTASNGLPSPCQSLFFLLNDTALTLLQIMTTKRQLTKPMKTLQKLQDSHNTKHT